MQSTVATTPEMDATLVMLSNELRTTMRKAYPKVLTRNFEEFAAMRSDLKIADPPPGTRYAISENWRVILVQR
jgi:hypothetical protein